MLWLGCAGSRDGGGGGGGRFHIMFSCVYIENQELRIEKSDWSIQISYALNKHFPSTVVYVALARGEAEVFTYLPRDPRL